jgi:uncharacterized protein GlcG (DUF336 family)
MDLHNFQASQVLLARAIDHAQQNYQRAISIALCDTSGLLLAFARAGNAPLRTIAIAQGKAYTSSRMGSSTTEFLARLRRENLDINHFCDVALTALPGGSVLHDTSGAVIGGVGISGLAPAEDQAVADMVADLAARGAL